MSNVQETYDSATLEKLLPLLEIEDGLILFSGEAKSGKTNIMNFLTQKFSEKYAETRRIAIINDNDTVTFQFGKHVSEGNPYYSRADNKWLSMEHIFRTAPDLIVQPHVDEPGGWISIIDTFQASRTGHLVYSTIESATHEDASERFVEHLLRENKSPERNDSLSQEAKKHLKAIVQVEKTVEDESEYFVSDVLTFN